MRQFLISTHVRKFPRIAYYNMIRGRIKDRSYQAWAASYIWWQYNLPKLDSYCALTQLAHVSLDYFRLSTEKLDEELKKIGLLKVPPYKDVPNLPAKDGRKKKGRTHPSLHFCLDERAVEFIENDNLIWVDLMQQMCGHTEVIKKHA